MEKQDEQQIIADYLAGNQTPEERKRFSEWLSAHPERKKDFRALGGAALRARWSGRWEHINEEKAYVRVVRRLRSRKLLRRMLQCAAIIIVAMTAGTLFLRQWGTEPASETFASIPLPGENRPILTLHNGQSLVLSDKPQAIVSGNHAVDIRLQDSSRLEYIPVQDTLLQSEVHYNTLTVPGGCEFSLALADGSRVWLNAGSELRYPERFAPGKREVSLKGEAYFEVARDTASPFFVRTDHMELQVLGTSFDISAYPDDGEVVTTLLTGSVAQRFDGRQEEIILRPSYQSVYVVENGETQIREADLEAVLAWKSGKFVARNDRLEDILRKLGRWYDFQVVYTDPRLRDLRFHIHCERYENVMDILERVEETYGIRFSEYNGTIYVSR